MFSYESNLMFLIVFVTKTISKYKEQFQATTIAAGNILDYRNIYESALEGQVGDISTEDLKGNELLESSLQFVGKYPVLHSLLSGSSVGVPLPHLGHQSVFPHNSLYFLVIHVWQSHFNASPAVFAFTFVKDFFDVEKITVVFVRLIYLY